jgi:hypothetical protein
MISDTSLIDKKILTTIDLLTVDNTSEKDLYNLLLPLHKDVYADNDRIVFTCFGTLTHTFDDLPADLLIRLQKMLVYVDIPNFFCIVISNQNLSEELTYVCNKYAVDENPMVNIICSK